VTNPVLTGFNQRFILKPSQLNGEPVFRAERRANSLRPAEPDPDHTGGGIIDFTQPSSSGRMVLCHVH
jgi:hypothetical protein